MSKRKKIYSCVIVLLLAMVFLVATIPQTRVQSIPQAKAQFVIASWDFPDEYGQGIYGFFILENSTGVFFPVAGPLIVSSNSSIFEMDAGIAIGFDVRVVLNDTLLGLTFPDDVALGLNYFRLNVTVTTLSETVFSQANFTYDDLNGAHGDLWYYSQEVEFDFLLVSGHIYTVTITYEVYY